MKPAAALLFDVGNTRVKWGLAANGSFVRTGTITHAKLREEGFGALTSRLPRDVDYVLASNVAGAAFATRLAGIVGIHCGRDLHFAHAERQAFGVTNGYRSPRRIGIDRWVALIGARAEFRSAVCIVDAGTAVTIDALDRGGDHLGGIIVPGLSVMAASLHSNTGEIPAVKPGGKAQASGTALFARGTDGAVRNGALTAVCGAIDRAVGNLRRAGQRPKVVLTGGDASRILAELDGNVLHRPHLVLQGLARMVPNRS